ncbi:MAG TPA: hypothetical protein VFY91_07485 [Microbacterium sp.]|nr:hypothetical protein [Microbacterium sp.]
MSVDPLTGAADGPYFIIGSEEYTLAGAKELAASLIAAAEAAAQHAFGPGTIASDV